MWLGVKPAWLCRDAVLLSGRWKDCLGKDRGLGFYNLGA